MSNENNLIPFTTNQSRDEAMKNGRKGGKASGVARRKKKLFKQLMNSYLDKEEHDMKTWNELSAAGFDSEEITHKAAIVKAMVDQATAGDVKAAALVMSMVGEDIHHEELKLKQKEFKLKELSKEDSEKSALDKLDEVLSKIGGED